MLRQYKKPQLYNAGGDIKKKWYVHYSYINPKTGKYQRIKQYQDLNSYHTKKERIEYADLLIKAIEEDLEAGYNPFAKVNEQTVAGSYTLEQCVPAFLATKERQLRGKTIMGYRSILNMFLDWAKRTENHDRHLSELTTEDVENYFRWAQKNRNLAPTTHNTELTTIRSFFTFWIGKRLINYNPASGIKRLREEVAKHTVYSDAQIKLITDYLSQSDTPRDKQLLQYIKFIYYTCIRPKEIRMLKVGDIRLKTDTILVPANVSKSGRSEPVDIAPGLDEVIEEMGLATADPDWYVFGNQAKGVAGDYSDPRPGPKPVGINYFSDLYRELTKELGLSEEHTLYSWKHTRNVHLYMEDKDLLRLMRHNRHTDPKVTMRYLRNLGLLVDTRIKNARRI
ncbi:site-specific integrase [Spirosoma sp. BT702]|uniref:Site-specific integrase n=1 Tax=Spirosoma profusum TaxID=2771354 RepID=A0A926Y3R7_9BACT|nr:phage integrase N-terminal SAM-like domain-containing protein [Spirosoma profusum]MBD2704402.1 site-specific integrase [Spirosoma profusum]